MPVARLADASFFTHFQMGFENPVSSTEMQDGGPQTGGDDFPG